MGKIIQIIVHINDASKGRIVSFFAMVSPNLGHTLHFVFYVQGVRLWTK